MQDRVMELAERGKALPVEDRSRLVDMLLDSLDEGPLAESRHPGTKRSSGGSRLSIEAMYRQLMENLPWQGRERWQSDDLSLSRAGGGGVA